MKIFASVSKGKIILLAITSIVLISLMVLLILYHDSLKWYEWIAVYFIPILISLCLFLFLSWRESQKAGQIEQSINSSMESELISPEKRDEIDKFKKQLLAAITALKNSKLGRKKLGKAALYSLPWYMILGPSGAGKTTALQNSGLDFPFGKDTIKGVGGTRNCDWFFSTHAVFLDTAGRYVSEMEDRPEWKAFLQTLKKYRGKKPVNGVIVALNIDEIIKSDERLLTEHANNIRSKLDELINELGIIFPVYLVFTKCDLIQGFVEYFGDFSETERSQIWGATLNIQPESDISPKIAFEGEFDTLAQVIHNSRINRLSNPLKREQRRKVFLFPYQFSSLKNKLTYLIGEVFKSNPYQDNPIFRGFYFTSGTQEGAPLDSAIREIAKQFNLPPLKGEPSEEIKETKNYFIKDLLNEVVIADQNFAIGKVAIAVKQNRLLRNVVIFASAFLLVTSLIIVLLNYNRSSNALDKIEHSAQTLYASGLEGDLLSDLYKVDYFRQLIVDVKEGNFDNSSFGLNRSGETIDTLTNLYLEKTRPVFEKNILPEIHGILKNYLNGRVYSTNKIYSYLKAYLLIGDERSRLDTNTQNFLTGIFVEILSGIYIHNTKSLSSGKADSLVRNYSAFIVDRMKNRKIYTDLTVKALVDSTRVKLLGSSPERLIYEIMKDDALTRSSRYFSIKELTKENSSEIMESEQKIPEFFVYDIFGKNIRTRIDSAARNYGKDNWVLGNLYSGQQSFSEQKIKKLNDQIIMYYYSEYYSTWKTLFKSIKYLPSQSATVASNKLQNLGDQTKSPLFQILEEFVKPDSANELDNFALNNPEVDSIKRIKIFTLGMNERFPPLELNKLLKNYKDYAEDLKNRQSGKYQSCLTEIQGIESNFPELKDLLIQPLYVAHDAYMSDPSSEINQQWKVISDDFNQNLNNKFPFNSESNADADMEHFKSFFQPDGKLWGFLKHNFPSSIDTKNGVDENNLPNSLKNLVKKANEIKTMFVGNDISLSFVLLAIDPHKRKVNGHEPAFNRYSLKIDNDKWDWNMGPDLKSHPFTWPDNKGKSNCKLEIEYDYYIPPPMNKTGDWALFNLLYLATLDELSNHEGVFTWKLGNMDVRYKMTSQKCSIDLFSRGFFKFNIPSSL